MYLLVLSESISAEPIEPMVQAYDHRHHDRLRSRHCQWHLRRVVDEMVDTGWIVNSTYLIPK